MKRTAQGWQEFLAHEAQCYWDRSLPSLLSDMQDLERQLRAAQGVAESLICLASDDPTPAMSWQTLYTRAVEVVAHAQQVRQEGRG
jgi:hypothetical protein